MVIITKKTVLLLLTALLISLAAFPVCAASSVLIDENFENYRKGAYTNQQDTMFVAESETDGSEYTVSGGETLSEFDVIEEGGNKKLRMCNFLQKPDIRLISNGDEKRMPSSGVAVVEFKAQLFNGAVLYVRTRNNMGTYNLIRIRKQNDSCMQILAGSSVVPLTSNYKYRYGTEYRFRFVCDTDSRMYSVYIDDECIAHDLQFGGLSMAGSLRILMSYDERYEYPAAAINENNCVTNFSVLPYLYIDDFKLYTTNMPLATYDIYSIAMPAKGEIQNAVSGKSHPYLLGDGELFEQLVSYRSTDPYFERYMNIMLRESDRISVSHTISDMAAFSEYAEKQIVQLAFCYRITGDEEYAGKALALMEKGLDIDWHQSNTVETADMSLVYAIGFDWLYDYIPSVKRDEIANTVFEKSLDAAYGLYTGGEHGDMPDWAVTCEHNWSLVCNSGFGAAALSFMEYDADICSEIVADSLLCVRNALSQLGKNGGWSEGVGYSQYGFLQFFRYLSMIIESSGSDYGILNYTPLMENLYFAPYLTGISDTFNFHDGSRNFPDTYNLMFGAKYYKNTDFAVLRRQHILMGQQYLGVYDLLWYCDADTYSKVFEGDRYFDTVETAVMRNSFYDKNSLFCGLHGGQNNVNHGSLDAGTFVLEMQGERWAVELGSDSYSLPGYFDRASADGARWSYYRNRAEGSNTLVINPSDGPDQVYNAVTKVNAYNLNTDNAYVRADMTSAYKDADKVIRTMSLCDGRSAVVINDDISVSKASEIYWFMHTKAAVEISADGKKAVLTQNGKRLNAQITSPSEAVFDVMNAEPLASSPSPDGQAVNHGIRKLSIHLGNVYNTEINVKFSADTVQDDILTEIYENAQCLFRTDFDRDCSQFASCYENIASKYKEAEIVHDGYYNQSMRLRYITDIQNGLSKSQNVYVVTPDFTPQDIIVFEADIKSENRAGMTISIKDGDGYSELMRLRSDGYYGSYRNNVWKPLYAAGNGYNTVRLILDVPNKSLTGMIGNDIIFTEAYGGMADFENTDIMLRELSGTAYNVSNDNISAACIYLDNLKIYTCRSRFKDGIAAETADGGMRIVNFGEDMRAGIFNAVYNTDGKLTSVNGNEITLINNNPVYINMGNGRYFIWKDNMMPVLEPFDVTDNNK